MGDIALGVLSNVAYRLTFYFNRPLEFVDPAFSSRVMTLHLSGMRVALAAATGLIAYFVGRVSEALSHRERELTEARTAAARSERMAGRAASTASVYEYVAIIRGEVDRCGSALDQLSGRPTGASASDTSITLADLIEDLRHRLGESLASRLDVSDARRDRPLTGVSTTGILTYMVKTQVYLRAEELEALHQTARRSGRPVADLVREAIRRVWLRPPARGPVALWDGTPTRTSVEHDTIYDEP
ncbi:MAG: CopG family transcriptional regulator [Acidobacteriota bacterium]